MATLIATIILISSLIGIGKILFRKIPILFTLPEVPEVPTRENSIFILKKRIKKIKFLKNFSYETFLQKILAKIRILTLKTEHKTSTLLQELRERQKKRKIEEADNYWEEIKKSTNRGKKRGKVK